MGMVWIAQETINLCCQMGITLVRTGRLQKTREKPFQPDQTMHQTGCNFFHFCMSVHKLTHLHMEMDTRIIVNMANAYYNLDRDSRHLEIESKKTGKKKNMGVESQAEKGIDLTKKEASLLLRDEKIAASTWSIKERRVIYLLLSLSLVYVCMCLCLLILPCSFFFFWFDIV